MNILFIGDIVGRSGRDIVFKYLNALKKEHKIDLVIANGENSAHGKGITKKIYDQFMLNGIDIITMGNHSYSKSEILDHLLYLDSLIMPINHAKNISKGYKIVNINNLKICICSILGEALMHEVAFSPFEAMDIILKDTKQDDIDFYFVDLHAEATAEKMLFAHYYKDKIDVVVGTHTHVQSADERLIDNLAYITDVGMSGVYDSIIGRDINESISSNILKQKARYKIAEGEAILCAVIIKYDEDSKKMLSIERIQKRPY